MKNNKQSRDYNLAQRLLARLTRLGDDLSDAKHLTEELEAEITSLKTKIIKEVLEGQIDE